MIREARPDEAEALAMIQRDASLAALAHIFPPELYPYPLEDVSRRWEDSLGDDEITVLVAEEDGAAAGVAGCRAEWLDGLYVLPQFWSRGVGRALHDEVLDRLRACRLRALPPLGARAQRPRQAFLRAAGLGRERHLACRPVSAEADRRRLLDHALDGIGVRQCRPEHDRLFRLGRVPPRVRVARRVGERVPLLELVHLVADLQLQRAAEHVDELDVGGQRVRLLAGAPARRDVRLGDVEAALVA